MASARVHKGYTITVTANVASNQWNYIATPHDPSLPILRSEEPLPKSRAAHAAAQVAIGRVVGFTPHRTKGAGRPKLENKKVQFSLTIDPETMNLLSAYAERLDISPARAASRLLDEVLRSEAEVNW